MKKIPESGFYNSNKFARIFIESIQEITGQNGVSAILNYADLSSLIGNYPPDNLDQAFDFAHFSMINLAMEDLYGKRGGRGMALRAGRTTFNEVLDEYGALAGVGDMAFKVLPLQKKISMGLNAMARVFTEKSDQISSVKEAEENYIYRIERCPICWGRENEDSPVCYYMVGLLKEALSWVSGGKEFRVNEIACSAVGDEACEFVIMKTPISS
jgi:predicted hydrocarbon binding protein